MEEMGNEFNSMVGGDMGWNSVLREDMEYEQLSQILRGNSIKGQDEYPLLGEPIYNNQDRSEA